MIIIVLHIGLSYVGRSLKVNGPVKRDTYKVCSSPVYGPVINASPLNFSALLKTNIQFNDPEI